MIPKQIVKADSVYYSVDPLQNIETSLTLGSRTVYFDFVYSDPNQIIYPVPEGTKISKDALQYVVDTFQAGNVTLFASQGYAVSQVVTDTFSFLFNVNMFYGDFVDQFIITPHTIKYYLHHWDGSDVPIGEKMYTYRFEYLGCTVDLALTPSGDFQYTNENGRTEHISNYRHSSPTDDLIGKGIRDQIDSESGKINTPFIGLKSFGDLKLPYIYGKELHFFAVRSGVETEYIIDDFRNVILAGMTTTPTSGFQLMFFFPIDGRTTTINMLSNNSIVASSSLNSNSLIYTGSHKYVFGNNNINVLRYGFYRFGGYDQTNLNFNLPMYYSNINTSNPDQSYIGNPNYLGWYNNSLVNGTGDIWLQSVTYSNIPTEYRPEVPLDLPIPSDQIIIYPDTELPDVPDGTPVTPQTFIPEDPIDVPGIPNGPDVVPLPPFPSIVSGNDDLWNITVQLDQIDVDLAPYLSGLSEFSFPSFDSLTSGIAGSIIWVSALISTLYNGTSFNILFIVLSLFFIVAALLGVYKWWHK